MNTGILTTPRTPTFDGVETISWGQVDKTFGAFVDAYYKRNHLKQPDDVPTSFAACPEDMREWISNHSVLGNPKSETFEHAVVLPVVNPHTGKLNSGGVRSANAYAGRVDGISSSTLAATKKILAKLYEDNFKTEVSIESYRYMDYYDSLCSVAKLFLGRL